MKEYNLLQLSKKLTSRGLGVKISKNPVLKEELLKLTCFLPDSAPQSLRIWCLKNDILSKEKLPKCPVCGKLPAFSTGKFRTYCSKRCSQLDKEKFIKKYGVEHHLKSKSVKEKRKKTVLEKYGVENIGIITREKAKKTTLEKYGVDNYTKTKEYKEKLVQTSILKYGTTHPMKSEKVKKFALLKDNEILQVISIGKARFGLDGYEIYRLATKKGYTVVGGLKKLIKRAYMEIGFKKLYSYINLRIFSGKGYEKVGFKRVKITEPDYYYTKDFINLYSRERFMRSKTGIPEKEFINKYNFHKIYGVGHALYLLEI